MHRLGLYLRALLKQLAGDSNVNVNDQEQEQEPEHEHDLDHEGEEGEEVEGENQNPSASSQSQRIVNVEELEKLLGVLEKLQSYPGLGEGRQDWAVERECEISRLEKENEELRKVLGIDEANMNACGVVLDPSRDIPRPASSMTVGMSMRKGMVVDGFTSQQQQQQRQDSASSYWGVNAQQQQQQQQQRGMELQPGMRNGPQGRRPGIFGGGAMTQQQQRGFVGGVGRGVSMAVNQGNGPGMWLNQPVPVLTGSGERLWQSQP